MQEIVIRVPVVSKVEIDVLARCIGVGLLKFLAKIPGTVAQTVLFVLMGSVFLGWQAVALSVYQGWGNPREMVLFFLQTAIIGLLCVKLVLYFRYQHVKDDQ